MKKKYLNADIIKPKDLKSETDWERVDALTDEEIEAAVASDPDAELITEEHWATAVLVIPGKKKQTPDQGA